MFTFMGILACRKVVSPSNRLRLLRPVRFPVATFTAYVLVVSLTVWFLLQVLPRFSSEDVAIPAMAGVSTSQQVQMEATNPDGGSPLWSPGINTLKKILREAMPLLPAAETSRESMQAGGTWFETRAAASSLLYFLAGVRGNSLTAILQSQIPVLAEVSPSPSVPVQYALFIPRPREIEAPESSAPANVSGDPRFMPASLRGWTYKGDGPLVIVYHTHTQESYLPSITPAGGLSPDEAFSADPASNMVAVGRVFAERLREQYGIGVIHVTQFFDVPESGNGMTKIGAYERSLQAIQGILSKYPSIQVIVDMHRDSASREITTGQVGGESVAKVMLVVGTDNYRDHISWKENLSFANQAADTMRNLYPGLFRSILIKEWRFNQHLAPGAVLMEIGGVDNTLEEATRSAELLGDVFAYLVKEDLIPRRPGGR